MYKPPPNLGYPEGNTEGDLTILTEKAIIFVEAKYHSEIRARTDIPKKIEQIADNMGLITWNQLHRI